MYQKELKELAHISQAVGNSPDLVQGGGGNTSVKLDDRLMAVKASGFKLRQITPTEGYVVVNYRNLREYYAKVDLTAGTDFEKESAEVVKKNVVPIEGVKTLRPSVEAGFHSILKRYVIHTHPVYTNILCCSREGRELVGKIFGGKEYRYIWIPYTNPGFSLTLAMQKEIDRCQRDTGFYPEVIFMENHGLVVTADKVGECLRLHEEVNNAVKSYLGIGADYPEIRLEKVDEETYISRTRYLTEIFGSGKFKFDEAYFERVALYPDQLVYLNGSISLHHRGENKLNINSSTGELIYKTGYNEALTIEETLLAYLYIIDRIEKHGLTVKTMTGEEIGFITNWESEKYRKNLLKELK